MKVITANLLNRFWTNGVKPIKTAVGTISSLTTTAKTNLVTAINEVKAKADSNATAITNVNNNLSAVGQVLPGMIVTTIAPSKTITIVSSLILQPGVYVVTAACQWKASFSEIAYYQVGGTVVRSTGNAGGGGNVALIYALGAERTLEFKVYNGSAISQQVQDVSFNAVRIR